MYVVIACGAFVGSVLRVTLEWMFASAGATGFPLATFVINLSGSFFLALIYGFTERREVKPWLRAGFGTGLLGSYTTFSTFTLDTEGLLDHHLLLAGWYGIASLTGGLILTYAGNKVALVILAQRPTANAEELSI